MYCCTEIAPADLSGGLQMLLDLPQDPKGLAWIARKGPAKLLLIPGVQAAVIAAAAREDQQALMCLRITAQQHAAGVQKLSAYQAFKLAAAGTTAPAAVAGKPQLKDVYKQRLKSTRKLMLKAVQGGQLAAFRWLRALCKPVEFAHQAALMTAAATGGHLEILQLLRSGPEPAPWDSTVSSEATGNLGCLKWLLSQDPPCPCDDCIIYQVAEAGNLDALKWLRALPSIPLDWWSDADLTMVAASHGSLEMLKWMRAQDPPCLWTEAACGWAATNDNPDLLQ